MIADNDSRSRNWLCRCGSTGDRGLGVLFGAPVSPEEPFSAGRFDADIWLLSYAVGGGYREPLKVK